MQQQGTTAYVALLRAGKLCSSHSTLVAKDVLDGRLQALRQLLHPCTECAALALAMAAFGKPPY